MVELFAKSSDKKLVKVSKLKYILLLGLMSLSFKSVALEETMPCPKLSFVDSLVKDLVKDMENISRHKAKKLATELILKQCQHEKEKGAKDIRIRDGKVKFSEFSYSWNVKDPVYFCKSKSGHASYLASMTQKLISVTTKKAPKRKPSQNKPRRPTPKKAEVKKEEKWDCIIPNYIKTVRRVNKAQMETLSITYGAASCSKVN